MHPVLVELGPLTIRSFGVMAIVATLVATGWAAGRDQLPGGIGARRLVELALWLVVAGLVGARLPLLVAARRLDPALLLAGGFFDVGVVAALLAAAVWCRREGIAFAALADRLIPAAPLAGAVGRIGCLLGGCCWGRPTHSMLAVVYRDPRAQALTGVPLGVGLHPMPVYLLAAEALIALVLLWHGARAPGRTLALWALLEGGVRLALEPWRGDPRGQLGPLTLSAWLATALVAAGAIGFARGRSR